MKRLVFIICAALLGGPALADHELWHFDPLPEFSPSGTVDFSSVTPKESARIGDGLAARIDDMRNTFSVPAGVDSAECQIGLIFTGLKSAFLGFRC